MTTQSVPAVALADGYDHTERICFAIFMVVAPLIVLAATIIHPPHGAENGTEYYQAAHDHSDRFYAVLPRSGHPAPGSDGAGAAGEPQPSQGGPLGGVLSAMGFIGWGALDGMDFMTYVAGSSSNLDTTTMQTYVDDALAKTAILVPVSIVFALLIIGMLVLCVGLHRAAIIPFWLALLMPLGVLGVISFLEYPPLLIGSALLLVVSIGTVRQLRASEDAVAEARRV
jgi:hypothetical protein